MEANYFTILWWFLPYIHMNQPWVYMCSPFQNLPPHPIPQGHPSAPALSTLSYALNLDWRSISHMMIYMFQCYSLRSSHPRLLPQSPKDCSLHLCLFCCLTCGVIVTIFEVSPKKGTCCLGPFPTGNQDVLGHGTCQRCSGGTLVKTHLGEVSSAVSICLFL